MDRFDLMVLIYLGFLAFLIAFYMLVIHMPSFGLISTFVIVTALWLLFRKEGVKKED
jgi:hypothetical protein